jgi:hypothetical protein
MTSPAELVRLLADRKVMVASSGSRPFLDGPAGSLPPDTLEDCQIYRWLFVWGLQGAATGHRWHACDVCDEVQLIAHYSKPRPCRMTAGCEGHLRRLPDLFVQPKQRQVSA